MPPKRRGGGRASKFPVKTPPKAQDSRDSTDDGAAAADTTHVEPEHFDPGWHHFVNRRSVVNGGDVLVSTTYVHQHGQALYAEQLIHTVTITAEPSPGRARRNHAEILSHGVNAVDAGVTDIQLTFIPAVGLLPRGFDTVETFSDTLKELFNVLGQRGYELGIFDEHNMAIVQGSSVLGYSYHSKVGVGTNDSRLFRPESDYDILVLGKPEQLDAQKSGLKYNGHDINFKVSPEWTFDDERKDYGLVAFARPHTNGTYEVTMTLLMMPEEVPCLEQILARRSAAPFDPESMTDVEAQAEALALVKKPRFHPVRDFDRLCLLFRAHCCALMQKKLIVDALKQRIPLLNVDGTHVIQPFACEQHRNTFRSKQRGRGLSGVAAPVSSAFLLHGNVRTSQVIAVTCAVLLVEIDCHMEPEVHQCFASFVHLLIEYDSDLRRTDGHSEPEAVNRDQRT